MSRLCYPKAANTATLVGGQQPNAAKDYLEKIAKLIPSKVLAVYLGLRSERSVMTRTKWIFARC
jgi:hypothetical protein